MNALNQPKHANGINSPLDGVSFKRLLVPVDFSVCTLETLRYAKAQAEKLDAVVDVLHVVQTSVSRDEAAALRPGLIRTMSEGAGQELKRLVGILWEREGNAVVSVRVREGRAHEVILREARFTNAALIIMAKRSRSWLSGLLRRNTVRGVIQHSPCPVMVVQAGMTDSGASRDSRNGPSFKAELNFG
jgi:nucleotide-binding universal stress UspA family protein